MTVVVLKYRRIDGVNVDGTLITSGLVEVTPAYRRDSGTGQVTTISDTYPVGSSITLAPDTYLFKLRASDGKGGRLKDEGVYRLVPPTGGPYDVDDLTEVTPSASGMTLSDVQALITAALAGVTPGPGGTPSGSGPGGLFYSVDVKDTTTAGRTLMTAANAAAQRTALDVPVNADLTPLAPKASPTFTGTPAAPTATGGTNTTQLATTAFVTTAVATKVSAASPTITGTADLVNLDVSGTAVFAADSIAQAAVNGLTTALSTLTTADSADVKLTGAQTVAGVKTFSSAPVVPDASFAVVKLSDIVSYLATTWGEIPTLYINPATGVWPSRTVPAGYTGVIRWDSTSYPAASAPSGAIYTPVKDRWRRLKP